MTENIAWGLRRGLIVAAGFSVIVSLEYIILGPGTVARIGVTLPTILLLYLSAGILGGIVLGVGRPLGKRRGGAMLLGVFVATVVYGSAAIAIDGLPNHWHGEQWFSSIFLGVAIGIAGGDRFFDYDNRS